MGWMFGWHSRKELIEHRTRNEQYERTPEGQTAKVLVQQTCLKHCFKGSPFRGTLWTVWEVTRTRPGEDQPFETIRYIGCDLLQYYREDRWGYKDLCESMGPNEVNCPLSYLHMVPVANAEWREKVERYHVKLMVGQTVKLREGCTPGTLTITSVKPLRGKDESTRIWKFSRGQIERVLS